MSKLILPVTHLRQLHPADCIAACATMILAYLNEPVEYDRLLRILQVAPEFGTAAFNIRLLALRQPRLNSTPLSIPAKLAA